MNRGGMPTNEHAALFGYPERCFSRLTEVEDRRARDGIHRLIERLTAEPNQIVGMTNRKHETRVVPR